MPAIPQNPIYGVIDIGSNTVLMTCGRYDSENKLEVLLECHEVARLGEGLQDQGPLQENAKSRVRQVLQDFVAQAKSLGPIHLLGAGTAAFRRACDGAAFAQELAAHFQFPFQILSGEDEARYSFLSAQEDFGHLSPDIGMIDIGGGSTEFVFGENTPSYSLPIGTVRLHEKYRVTHPISDTLWQKISADIRQELDIFEDFSLFQPKLWVGVAATPATLASVMLRLPSFMPEKIQGYRISQSELVPLIETLRHLSLPERQKIPGMDPKRAELLPLGGKILLEAMQRLKIDSICTSHRGLRYGLLSEQLKKSSFTT